MFSIRGNQMSSQSASREHSQGQLCLAFESVTPSIIGTSLKASCCRLLLNLEETDFKYCQHQVNQMVL